MSSVYFYPIDFISDTAAVTKQARNVLPEDFTTQDVEAFEYQAYSFIRTILNKDDWDANDREFGAIQRINTDLAVAYIRKHYGRTDEIYLRAQTLENSCIEQLKTIAANLDTATGEEQFTIARTARKSWNLNPAVEVPRSNLTIS